ncbi:MAG: nucleoside-triphosphatase, partial [Candidatus Omnitrophica bacterium]|nr:nucleoside-triphosphatase [Candidatus Omnitrophota bacterium]
ALQCKFRLGRYGVDIKGLEDIGLSAIREGLKQGKIIVIDEIGKMEFFSEEFRKEIISLLSLDITLIGVIHREFLSLIKDKSQIKLLEVTPLNHYQILNECKEWIRKNLQI